MSEGGRYEVCSADRRSVRRWDRKTQRDLTRLALGGEVVAVAASPRGGREEVVVAAFRRSATSCSLSMFDGENETKCAAPGPVTALACGTRTEGVVIAGLESGQVYVWETTTGALVLQLGAHFRAVRAIALAPFVSPGAFVTASDDGSCCLWSLARPHIGGGHTPLVRYAGHTLPITAVAVGTLTLVTAAQDRTVKVWHAPTGSCLMTVALPAPASAVSLDLSERLVAVGMNNGNVAVADLVEGRGSVRNSFRGNRAEAVSAICFSPSSTEILVGDRRNDVSCITIYDAASGQRIDSREDGMHTSVTYLQARPLSLSEQRALSGEQEANFSTAARKGDRMPLPVLQQASIHDLADYSPVTAFSLRGAHPPVQRARLAREATSHCEKRLAEQADDTAAIQASAAMREVQRLREENERLRASGSKLYEMLIDECKDL